jgi:hypothetical protein
MSYPKFFFVVALGALLSTACGGGMAAACERTDDCEPGSVCLDDRCQPIACGDDEDCPAGSACDGSGCVPAECRGDDDCPNSCEPTTRTCVECVEDADCPRFSSCDDNACVAGEVQPPSGGVDVLFVIDNSPSMRPLQETLVASFSHLVERLEIEHGGRPDLHLGVITTDMGTTPYNIARCLGAGDGGTLQNTPRLVGCDAPSDRYIVDVSDGAGGRSTNYAGSIDAAFACIASVGEEGCGFERPLDALSAAITNADNAGFFRDDAALAVVIVTNADDCSAVDTSVYDPTAPDAIGPLSAFRCFEHGVVCDPDQPRQAGSKHDCTPRTGSYMVDPADIAPRLAAIKPPEWLTVAVIAGPAAPVEVGTSTHTGNAELHPSCGELNGQVTGRPAVRLEAFASHFPRRAIGEICDQDFHAPLGALAAEIAAILE